MSGRTQRQPATSRRAVPGHGMVRPPGNATTAVPGSIAYGSFQQRRRNYHPQRTYGNRIPAGHGRPVGGQSGGQLDRQYGHDTIDSQWNRHRPDSQRYASKCRVRSTWAVVLLALFGSTGTYIHNQNGGTIPTATWNAASNCRLTGITNAYPSGAGQTFGHFTFNSPLVTDVEMSSNLTTAGNLNISGQAPAPSSSPTPQTTARSPSVRTSTTAPAPLLP